MSLEQIVINGLNVNDGTNFILQSLTFTPAQKSPVWAANADADGDTLVREPHYTNAYFDLQVRVKPRATAALALAALGELTDTLQAAAKVEGGIPVEWTPKNHTTTYTAYATLGEMAELPTTAEGSTAGWTFKSPVLPIKLTCRPFLYVAERTAKSATESAAEPLQILYLKEVKGDVPAEARLIVKDTATQDRRFAMWGRDAVTSETNPAILLSAKTGLTGTGFSGEAKTRTGAYLEEKVLRATALQSAAPVCGTGRIEHVGSYAVYVRVYATSTTARFRISYRNGDGPLIPLEWKQPAVVNGWAELYMGTVALDAVTIGTQTSEVRLEQKATTGNPANDVNYLELWPTKASGKARGIANNESTGLVAYDFFEQSEGSLATKALNFGGTWTGAGDAVDFKVIEATHIAQRTEVSDASLVLGRYGIAGTTESTGTQVSATVSSTTFAAEEKLRTGVFARYLTAEKWVMAFLTVAEAASDVWIYLKVVKNVSGVTTVLGETKVWNGATNIPSARISLSVAASGSWKASVGGVHPASLEGLDSALATGGALEKGKVGIYDVWTAAGANTRKFDNFEAFGVEAAGRACYSGRVLEFNSQGALRQDSTGTYDGPPSSYRGAGFYLEPEGKLGLINRVVVRMRRNDNEVEEDSNVTDKMSVEIKVRERYLIPR